MGNSRKPLKNMPKDNFELYTFLVFVAVATVLLIVGFIIY